MAVPIAAGLQAIGMLMQGFGANAGGRARRSSLRANARMERSNAAMEGQAIADDVERAAAAAAVMGAGAGGGFGGSAGDVLADLERRGRFNLRSAIWQGNTRAAALEQDGEVAATEGKIALLTSVVGAGSTLASGFATRAEAGKQAGYRSAMRQRRGG